MNSSETNFDVAYYINLDHRQDRKANFERAAQFLPVKKVIRYPAIYGTELDRSKWDGTPGALGIRESHIRLLKHAKEEGVKRFFIFEDDAVIKKTFPKKLNRILDEIGDDWDMIYLYAENHYLKPINFSKNVIQLQNTLGLVGLAYNNRNIDVIIDKLENDYRWVDSCMADLHVVLKVYAPKKSIIAHANGFSDNIEVNMRTDVTAIELLYQKFKTKAKNGLKRLKNLSSKNGN